MKFLGIIPARGGSKGVKRKNIRMVCGKPLMAYTIEAAKASKKLTDFYLSTEDDEIEQVAKEDGVKVLKRPYEIAGDKTPMVEVVLHAFSSLKSRGLSFDAGVLLQPTCPLRTSNDIDQAIDQFLLAKTPSLVSVYQVSDAHPSRMYTLDNDTLTAFYQEPAGRLRQDLTPVYHRNGAIYIFSRELAEKNQLWNEHPKAFIMPHERSLNIDEEVDLVVAEALIAHFSNSQKSL